MSPTVHLTDALPNDRATIDCEAVQLKGSVAWIEPAESDERLVVPIENLAGVEGADVEREVEHIPTQGGQYSEVVTHIS